MKQHITKLKINFHQFLVNEVNRFATRQKPRNLDEEHAKRVSAFLLQSDLWERTKQDPVYAEDCGYPMSANPKRDYPTPSCWLYQDTWYYVTGKFTDDQKKLLVLEFADSERKLFEKLHMKFYSSEAIQASRPRERVPEGVRIAVWRRDQGRCVKCGSRENLEFDHIIPVEKGGNSTVRNVQLLCDPCNSKKGNKVDEVGFKLE